MKRNRLATVLIIMIVILVVAGNSMAAGTSVKEGSEKYVLTDLQPYQFTGIVTNVSPKESKISVNGMIVEVVVRLEMKNKPLTTLMRDIENRSIPLELFKNGNGVKVTAFKFPDGSYVGATLEITDATEKKKSRTLK